MAIVDLTERINNGRLTQIGEKFKVKETWTACEAVFQCECGNIIIARVVSVRNGKTSSCSCLQKEINTSRLVTHGKSNSPTYNVWCHIKSRCRNRNCDAYRDYGGRGISMCDRWFDSYEAFLMDMGEKPESLSIERKNNSGNYEPGNCKWATTQEQMRNTRRNVTLTLNSKTRCLTEWAEKLGVSVRTLQKRVDAGWDKDTILTVPVGKQRNPNYR